MSQKNKMPSPTCANGLHGLSYGSQGDGSDMTHNDERVPY